MQLRASLKLTIDLPENPSRLAAVIAGIDAAVDDFRSRTGVTAVYESEIVRPRRLQASLIEVGPRTVATPAPFDPRIDTPPTVVASGGNADLLEIPSFLERK